MCGSLAIFTARLFPIDSFAPRSVLRLLANRLLRQIYQICCRNGNVVYGSGLLCVFLDDPNLRLFAGLSETKDRDGIDNVVRWNKSTCSNSAAYSNSATVYISVRGTFNDLLNGQGGHIAAFSPLDLGAYNCGGRARGWCTFYVRGFACG